MPVVAIQLVVGLTPGATYHYRLVAHSDDGTVDGSDLTFTTTVPLAPSAVRPGIPGTGFLPNNRGWEQVSPVDKNGGDVTTFSMRTRAAADGGAATFTSLIASGDVQGTGIASEYMAIRNGTPGTTGWTTHTITPKQNPLTYLADTSAFDPLWEGEFSPDLSRGVFRAWSPLTNAPNVADVENLYLRTDLRTPGAGTYTLLTNCPLCATPLDPNTSPAEFPKLAGASSDFTHVIFESIYPLVPGATANPATRTPNLYEWDNGTLRLASILPDGTVAARSVAGRGANRFYTMHTISSDGSRIIFTDDSATGDDSGVLFQRIDGTSTIQLNASEKTNGSGPGGTDSGGARLATFWAASDDGTRVFFTTSEQLTNDDNNSAADVYMYDANAPADHHLARLSIDNEPADPENDMIGVIGTSSDGHYVYFVGSGQLSAGKPALFANFGIYEWHEGTVSYIGRMPAPESDTSADLPQTAGLTPMSARVTPDGRHLLFVSHRGAGLLGYDQGNCGGLGCQEVYVYSADTHQLACASCNPIGAPATSDAVTNAIIDQGGAGGTWHLNHPLSDDGKHVFFSTAEALVPEDVNGRSDVYEYDVPTGTVHLLSSGTAPSDSSFMDASADGHDAFFVTRQQLTGWDDDQNADLYDARIGGGLPEPPATSADCEGDACRAAGSQPAGGVLSGSATFAGPGDVTGAAKTTVLAKRKTVVKCKRGFVARKVHGKTRCVKRAKRRVVRKAKGAVRGR